MNSGIEMLRQLADDLEEEAKQVERLDREADELRRENAKLREIIDAMKADAEAGAALRRDDFNRIERSRRAVRYGGMNPLSHCCQVEEYEIVYHAGRLNSDKALVAWESGSTPHDALKKAGLLEVEK